MTAGEMLPPPVGPSHLPGVYPGSPRAPQKPAAGCAGPEACWSELQPEVGRTTQTALKSKTQKKIRVSDDQLTERDNKQQG